MTSDSKRVLEILIVGYYGRSHVNPRAFRSISLEDAFVKLGHDVTSIALGEEISPGPNRLQRSRLRNTAVWRMADNVFNFLFPDGARFFSLLKYYRKIPKKNVDLLISVGLPFSVHIVSALALKLGKVSASRSVADYGDPFSNNPTMRRPRYFSYLERRVTSVFDRVSVPVASAIPAYTDAIDGPDKVVVIPQGVDLGKTLRSIYVKNTVPTFCYAGRFYRDIRNPEAFFEHLSGLMLMGRDFYFYVFCDRSDSANKEILNYARLCIGDRLVVKDLLPRYQCVEFLGRMDFLVNIGNTNNVQQPSKIIDYSLSGRPFLTIRPEQKQFTEFDEFLSGNYSSFQEVNVKSYDHLQVATEFICCVGLMPHFKELIVPSAK